MAIETLRPTGIVPDSNFQGWNADPEEFIIRVSDGNLETLIEQDNTTCTAYIVLEDLQSANANATIDDITIYLAGIGGGRGEPTITVRLGSGDENDSMYSTAYNILFGVTEVEEKTQAIDLTEITWTRAAVNGTTLHIVPDIQGFNIAETYVRVTYTNGTPETGKILINQGKILINQGKITL